jgi:hypothetical protein
MAAGTWTRLIWSTVRLRQAMAMGENEEPIDVDPYRLLDQGHKSNQSPVAEYNPAVLESLQSVGKVV